MRSWSFGLMQILGETARERGFAGRFLTQLCDPSIGLEYGCRQLSWVLDMARKKIATPSLNSIFPAGTTQIWSQALLFWNGGSDLAYPDRVLNRLAKYRLSM